MRWMTMNPGKQFEGDFADSARKFGHYVRIRDPILENRSAGGGYTFGDRCPYDCLLYRYPHQYCLELKSTAGSNISYDGASPMIKKHQIEELAKAARTNGVFAGFILNFRRSGRTWFIDIRDFLCFRDASTRKSLNENDCILIGTEVPGTKKKVHWDYDLSPLWGEGQIRLED